MNNYHQDILQQIKKLASHNQQSDQEIERLGKNYFGTNYIFYHIPVPKLRKLAKTWASEHSQLNFGELIELVSSLYQGESNEEICFGPKLLECFPKLRQQIDPNMLDKWLDNVSGWVEVDSLCQGLFTYKEVLLQWDKWFKLITKLNLDKNVHKRRASLVLLTSPISHSDDQRLSDLAFSNIDHLKKEKDVLITKAISWVLRSLIKYHRQEVEQYLQANKLVLPKIAVREVQNKLSTGKK